MENLILVFAVLLVGNYLWQKLKKLFKRKTVSNNTQKKTIKTPDDNREIAISNLMANLEKAKANRPEIIENNPKLAAKIIKLWVDKK